MSCHPYDVARPLHIDIKFEKPVSIEKYKDDKKAKHHIKIHCVPKNIGVMMLKFPFKECSHGKVNSIPQAENEISPFPNLGYVV
jgi:hypothetical protein